MRSQIFIIAGLVLFTAACDSYEHREDASFVTGHDLSVASHAKAPPESGVVIRWSNDVAVFVYFNPKQEVVSTHATVDVLDFACGNDLEVHEPLSIKQVVTPQGPTVAQTSAELHVLVYSPSSLTLPDLLANPCAALQSQNVAAEGYLTQSFNDNDIWGYGGRHNAFSVRTHGRIDLVGGGQATYRLFRHWEIKQDGSFRIVKEKGPELVGEH